MSVTPISDRLREEVIALHGSRCLRCLRECTHAGKYKLHIDHVIPEALGGRTHIDNLQVLCRTCNLVKGTNTWDFRLSHTLPGYLRRQRTVEALESTIVTHHRLHLYSDDRRAWRRHTVVCECGTRDWSHRTRDGALFLAAEHIVAMEKVWPERDVPYGEAVVDLTLRLPIRDKADLAQAKQDLATWGQPKPAPVTVPTTPVVSTYVPGGLPPKIAAIADVLTPEELDRLLELERV